MALIKDTNSYVDVADATAYFEDRIDAEAWVSAAESLKEQALVTATAMLDQKNWVGYAVSTTQLLAFPRNGIYFDPRLGVNVTLESDVVPDRVLKATYEQAYHLLNNDGLLDNTGGIESLKVGPIELKNVKESSKINYTVKNLITPLLINAGSSLWWRAN